MLRVIYLLLCVLASCAFGLQCLRESKKTIVHTLLILLPVALICLLTEQGFYDDPILTLPMLLGTAAIWQSEGEGREGLGLYLFFTSGGAYSLLFCAWESLSAAGGFGADAKLPLCLCLAAAIVLLPKVGARWIPDASWRTAYGRHTAEGHPLLRIDGTAAIWGIGCMAPAFCGSIPLLGCLGLCAGFVGGLLLLALMVAYDSQSGSVMELQKELDGTQRFMRIVRSQRHDYNFHLHTLQTLLLQEEYTACQAYLSELVEDSISMNAILPLADPAICALVHSFDALANQAGTRLHLEIRNDLSRIVTNSYETNKILGNLLQNALEETMELGDASYGIHLSIIKRGRYCMLRVSNRVRDIAGIGAYQTGISSKTGHEGIGLAAAKELAGKHQGTVYSRMEGDIVHFVAKIPLQSELEAEA